MKTPDLWLLIESLEGKEHTRIRKFLASSYFNSDEKHLQLFEAVLEQVKEDRCNREALDAIIYPYQPFSYTRITNLISDLKKLVERFFIQEELKKQTFSSEFLLLQAMEKKDLPRFFLQSEERIKQQIKEEPFRTETRFLENYLQEDLAFQFALPNQPEKASGLVGKKIKSLHLFYVMAMIRSVCQDLNLRANRGESGTSTHRFFIQYILDNHQLYAQEVLIRLYIRVLRMLIRPSEADFFENLVEDLESTQKRAKKKISNAESWQLFLYAREHVHRTKHMLPDAGHRTNLYRLYAMFLRADQEPWVISEGYLSPAQGSEYLSLLVESQQEAEAEKFISDYSLYNDKTGKQEIVAFFQAYVFYKCKDNRKEALKLLHEHNLEATSLAKELPLLITQIYYDSYQDQELKGFWEKQKLKIKKDKRYSASERDMYEDFKKYTFKLIKLRRQANILRPTVFDKNRDKLEKEIQTLPESPLSSWLMTELNQLK